MEIAGRQVLITGANRGIGRGLAKMAAESQAHLHLAVRQADEDFKQELLKAGAPSVRFWVSDLASRQGTEALLQALSEQEIDILINNAGQLTGGLIEEQPLDEIYSMFQVNLLSLVQLTRGLLPGMVKRGRGKIVNNASVSAIMHFPCASTYAASKAAVLAFTDCIRAELKGTGVETLCLLTPGIKTRMFDEIEVKYGKNFETPKDSISPSQYAQIVKDAILNDLEYLEPGGVTGIGLKMARHTPSLFNWIAQKRFRR